VRAKKAAKESVSSLLNQRLESVLESEKNANVVFDILEFLESDSEEELLHAIRTCSRLFGTLLERGELFVGQLPEEEDAFAASYSAEEKYKIWMRYRYNSCIHRLLELMVHASYQKIKELALCTLMKFVKLECEHPLVKSDWDEHYNFPHELLKVQSILERLLQVDKDSSLLISRFHEFLEYEDVRYYVMTSVNYCVTKFMQKVKEAVLPVYQQNVFTLISSVTMPEEESELTNCLVKQEVKHKEQKVTKLKEHKRAFERMWLGFLKHKLPTSLYKKVLVILHDSILPHMSKPTLMIDFLTAAYEIVQAHTQMSERWILTCVRKQNLEYPDFYKKLYNLLDPSVFHVKYRARFFHLANLFLSSTHLPVYLVAAFVKRLARLSLTAPPQVLLMVVPFICNLIRRHPTCRLLLHRPTAPQNLLDDPYLMEEEDPTKCRALESSLWELKTLQKHYHPDVASAAAAFNKPLSEKEDDLSELLEISAFEIFEKELKKKTKNIPLEFEPAKGLFGKKNDILAQHFALE
uniref:Nucleolar complex associated 4 homolog n=1 Tax=Latimeria chalumnae TaxID=7897 RepID=H3BGV2_LATCH